MPTVTVAPPDGEARTSEEASTNLVEAAPTVGIKYIFRRFWPETEGLRFRLFLGLVLVLVGPALDTASIYLFKVLVDDVFTPGDFSLFPMIAAAYLAMTVIEGVLGFFDNYLSTWVGERFLLRLRTKLFAHLHRLSLGFFERRQLGDVLSRLTADIAAIEGLVLSGVGELLSHGLKIFFFGGMLFWLNWKLALISLIAAPLFGVVSRYFSRKIKKASREKRRRSGAIGAVAEESLSNVALVQAYDRADDEVDRFHRENAGSFRAQMIATRLQSTFTPIIDVIEVGGVLLVMGFAVSELAAGRLTLGGLLAFIAYLTQLYGPVRGLGSLYNSIYSASAGAERVIELLDEQPLVTDPAQPRPLGRARGALTVENVDFAYPGTDKLALTGVSFIVGPGQKIAVVGASGAGKSSLAKLLLRTYDPDAGRVTLDGVDLRDLALSDLRRNVVAVLQETLVFDGTIRDNILWGRPGATEAEMVAAAEAADAHTFIAGLPDGYDTRVGQRGRMLSGGQRQRLAIARAMIRDAPVLLLDEPTTGLDAASSRRVLAPLRRLMSGRTTLIISHNLLTVTDADQILYLEGGRITGSGTHEELLAGHPGYAELYRLHQEPDTEAGRATPQRSPQPTPSEDRTAAIPLILHQPRHRPHPVFPAQRGPRTPLHTDIDDVLANGNTANGSPVGRHAANGHANGHHTANGHKVNGHPQREHAYGDRVGYARNAYHRRPEADPATRALPRMNGGGPAAAGPGRHARTHAATPRADNRARPIPEQRHQAAPVPAPRNGGGQSHHRMTTPWHDTGPVHIPIHHRTVVTLPEAAPTPCRSATAPTPTDRRPTGTAAPASASTQSPTLSPERSPSCGGATEPPTSPTPSPS